MWDLIVSVPDHCLFFYFACTCTFYQFCKVHGCLIDTKRDTCHGLDYEQTPSLLAALIAEERFNSY